MKKILKKALNIIGYEMRKVPSKEFVNHNSMQATLQRIKNAGINPQNVVDVGAASGKWTRKALTLWPKANYHLIEPLEEQKSVLDNLVAEYSNICYHTGVAGAEQGTISFSVSDDLDGSGVYGKEATNVRELPVLTLDTITKKQPGTFLIKLDTHGYEIPILEGAKETLKYTEALIIEVYGFYVSPTGLLFHQLSSWLEEKGFRLFDIVDVMRRDKDLAFWQADATYLKANHSVFKDNNYR